MARRFPHARAALLCLGLVLLAHAQLLAPLQLPAIVAPAVAMRVSLLPPAVPPALPPTPVDPAPSHKPVPAQASRAAASQPEEALPPWSPPPSFQWRYRLLLNGREGEAVLSWAREGDHYRLQLDRSTGDRALPGWRSIGRTSAHGVEPERYAELRGERDARATNFRREEGLISYSASSEVLPLPEGVQDKLSWWLQLAALASPDRSVGLLVASTRGDPALWHFEWQGREQGLWRYRREAQQAWDGTLEVWLDPARQRLPVRLTSGDPTRRGWLLELKSEASP